MVQLLILYYLSLKSTHGYEIQKFIQLSKMDQWNNIQSGSIYYAMSKLEKDGFIMLIDTIGHSEKSKRIFSITEKGRSHLREMAISELQKPLASVCSEKFLIYPIVANLTKTELSLVINAHIKVLESKGCDIDRWAENKENTATTVEKATLKLMRDSVENQIIWHKVLLENIEATIEAVAEISQMIKTMDFSGCEVDVTINMK